MLGLVRADGWTPKHAATSLRSSRLSGVTGGDGACIVLAPLSFDGVLVVGTYFLMIGTCLVRAPYNGGALR
jgi:hypothetical protein